MAMRTAISLLLLSAISLAMTAPPVTAPPPPPATQPDDEEARPPLEEVELGGETFKLEIAADAEARALGLMGRTEIADDGGMIFIYPRAGFRSFWMFDCVIDIDLIYLDARGRIVSTHTMRAEPPRAADESLPAYEHRLKRYPSRRLAQYAIELKVGTIERLEVEVGDRIELDLRTLRRMAS